MNRSRDMTLPQRAIVDQLKSEQFAVVREDNTVVVLQRGNDFRLVRMDGTQKRALGARR
jgi:hypothetical protein